MSFCLYIPSQTMEIYAKNGAFPYVQALSAQGSNDAGQCIPHTTTGQSRIACAVYRNPAVRCRRNGRCSLENQNHLIFSGIAGRHIYTVLFYLRRAFPSQPGKFAYMRRKYQLAAAGPKRKFLCPHSIQGVSIHNNRAFTFFQYLAYKILSFLLSPQSRPNSQHIAGICPVKDVFHILFPEFSIGGSRSHHNLW